MIGRLLVASLLLAATAQAATATPRLVAFSASRDAIDLEREQGTWLSARIEGVARRALPRAEWRVDSGEWKAMRIVAGSRREPRVLAFVKASELGTSGPAHLEARFEARFEARACLGDECGEVATAAVPVLARFGFGAVLDPLTEESWASHWTSGADDGVRASGTASEHGGFVLRGERTGDGAETADTDLVAVHARWSGSLPLAGSEGVALRVLATGGGEVWAAFSTGSEPAETRWIRLPDVDEPSWMLAEWSALWPGGMSAPALTSVTLAVAVPAGGSSELEISGLRAIVRGGEPWPHDSGDVLRCSGVDARFAHHPTRAEESVVVTGRKERGCLVVPATVEEESHASLLVDTGVAGCAFMRKSAERLGLAPDRSILAHDGTSEAEVPALRLDSLRVGSLVVDGAWAAVFDIELPADEPIDGVVAPSLLPEGLVTLDLDAATLMSEPGALPPADGVTIFDLEWGVDGAEIVVPFAGEPTRFILDSGSTLAVTLPRASAATMRLLSKPAEIDVATAALNDLRIVAARVSGVLELGDTRVVDPVVDFQGDDVGLLGVQVLRHFLITLDYPSQRVRLVPRSLGEIRLPGVKLNGLFAGRSPDGEGWIVSSVLRGTPAARKRVRAGAIIREVNGENASGLTHARCEELQSLPLTVVLESDGRARTVRLEPVTLVP